MLNKVKNQSGFTIVELLIVIVVIGILAALVLNTFQGVQARARDTERKTDINSISTQLEAYYADYGYYPDGTAATACDDGTASNVACTLNPRLTDRGLDDDALVSPNSNGIVVDTTAATDPTPGTTLNYFYDPEGCTANHCTDFELYADMEADSTDPYVKDSLN
jgi:prepilin-type N-terminal cleavage/methylation domain-containing protein